MTPSFPLFSWKRQFAAFVDRQTPPPRLETRRVRKPPHIIDLTGVGQRDALPAMTSCVLKSSVLPGEGTPGHLPDELDVRALQTHDRSRACMKAK
jgi:hypothetical protein